MLCSNHQEAVDFPRGEIVLGFCTKCGLISNVAFDRSKLDYSSLAPEEQGFSTTFNVFAQKLAARLIETHNLRKKRILEIGCGRGDFLALICELGDNLGVGIDPSPVVGDLQDKVGERLKFIRDYYSERYGAHHGNLVCCRHTLEHIHDTADFLYSVRRGIGDSLETSVFFEVPDVTRILREVAFWDIYYEHCSYFSPGSLARLFRLCKFEVTSLVKDYFDQYLLIEGKPVNEKSEKILEVEDSIEQTAKDVSLFSSQCQSKLDWWKNQLRKIKVDKKRAIVWGSGSKCVAFMTTLGVEDEIEFVVDINPHRHGKFVPGVGKQIMAPEFLTQYKPDIVIVMNPAYSNEIKHTLDGMEIAAKLIPCS
jgi:SAM-dependent methyltransferase